MRPEAAAATVTWFQVLPGCTGSGIIVVTVTVVSHGHPGGALLSTSVACEVPLLGVYVYDVVTSLMGSKKKGSRCRHVARVRSCQFPKFAHCGTGTWRRGDPGAFGLEASYSLPASHESEGGGCLRKTNLTSLCASELSVQ